MIGIVRGSMSGGFLGALANLGLISLPFVSKFAHKNLAPLASGAVNALGSLGIEKLISGEGLLQNYKNIIIKNKIGQKKKL